MSKFDRRLFGEKYYIVNIFQLWIQFFNLHQDDQKPCYEHETCRDTYPSKAQIHNFKEEHYK